MSVYRCIASNSELDEIENTKIEKMTINQAKDRGVNLPDFLLENKNINHDRDLVIASCQSEEDFNELVITSEKSRCFGNEYCQKKYISQLSGKFTLQRLEVFCDYIIEHLKNTDEIEVWQLWEDEILEPTIIHVSDLNHLRHVLNEYLNSSSIVTPVCIRVSRSQVL